MKTDAAIVKVLEDQSASGDTNAAKLLEYARSNQIQIRNEAEAERRDLDIGRKVYIRLCVARAECRLSDWHHSQWLKA